MALRFGNASTDKVVVTNPQDIIAGSEFSFFEWVRFNSDPVPGYGSSKGAIDLMVYSSTGAAYYLAIGRASGTALARAGGLYPQNVWLFIAGTYSEVDGPRLFRGGIGDIVVEEAYFSRAVGSGNTTANSGDLFIHNRTSSSVQSPGSDVATFAWFNRRLTLAELQEQQFAPKPGRGCTYFSHLGLAGSSALDQSGNARTGQITGTTLFEGPPMRMPMPDELQGLFVQPVII